MFRTALMLATMLIPFASVNVSPAGAENTQFDKLHRLSNVLQKFGNLDFDPAFIVTWREGPGVGNRTNMDGDSDTLKRSIEGWGDKCENMDLKNVAIVSDGDKTIRFVDYIEHAKKEHPEIILQRGDVVVLMKPTADVKH